MTPESQPQPSEADRRISEMHGVPGISVETDRVARKCVGAVLKHQEAAWTEVAQEIAAHVASVVEAKTGELHEKLAIAHNVSEEDDEIKGCMAQDLAAAQAAHAALRAKIVTLRDALQKIVDYSERTQHCTLKDLGNVACAALASTAEFSGQTVISMERLADLEQDAKRLDGYQSILRRALGAGTRERHLSCDVHLGKPIRDAIDAAMAQTEGGQP